jgi:hypothetical protein
MTFEQAQAPFRGTPLVGQIARVVKSGFMPYRIRANPEVEQLTDAEKEVIVGWAESNPERASCEPDADGKNKPPRVPPAPASRPSAALRPGATSPAASN